MSFGLRWAAILLLFAYSIAPCVRAMAGESRVVVVLRNDAGVPLAGVSISAQQIGGSAPPPPLPFSRTDEDGRFELSVANGEWLIQPDVLDLNQRGYLNASQRVTINNEGLVVNLVARRPNTSLFGKVTDDAGVPVANVRVSASFDNNTFGVQTDADGNYSLRLGAGRWWIRFEERELQEHGLVFLETVFPEVTEGEDKRLDIELVRPRLVLAANVRDSEGRPVENGLIDALREGTVYRTTARIVGGVGELRLSSGPWIVTISPFGYSTPERRRVVMAKERHEIDFTVDAEITVEIAGRVIDEDGNGVSRVGANMRTFTTRGERISGFITADDGTFALSATAGHILFYSDNNALIPRTILHAPVAGRYQHVIRMRRATGELVMRPSGPGDTMFTASAFHEGRLHTVSRYVHGQLRIPVFNADWQISVDAYANNMIKSLRSVPFRGGSEVIDLEFAPVEQSARIRGQVLDSQNKPVGAALIRVFRETLGHLWQEFRADANGAFDVAVAEGDWRVSVDEYTSAVSRNSVVHVAGVKPGEVREVGAIRWPWSGGRAVVRLKDEGGNPLDTDWPYLDPANLGARVRAEHAGGFFETVAITPGNEFTFDVAPGKWMFSLWSGELNRVGYAAVPPIDVDVSASGATLDVAVRRLGPGSEAPRLDVARKAGSEGAVLSVFAEEFRPFRIEVSNNLRDWSFYGFSEWDRQMVVPWQAENRFFRAVSEY